VSKPTDKQLIPLHTHTVFSVLDGASTIDEYLRWCKDNGAPALGVTDHGWIIGALETYEKGKKAGVLGIPGCEFYVAPAADYKFGGKSYDYYHVTIWAHNEVGYRNLMKLGSLAFNGPEINGKKRVISRFGQTKPRITFDELFAHNEGLVCGSGCLIGAVNKALLQGERDGAELNLLRMREVFGDRFFVEIMPHACTHDYDRKTKEFVPNECTDFSPDGDLQKACNLANIDFAQKHGMKLLMTVDSHFVHQKQKPLQDVLLQNGDDSGWRFYNSYHMLTTDDAWEHWSSVYGADEKQRRIFAEAVENQYQIVDLAKSLKIKSEYRQPAIKLPSDIAQQPVSEALKLKLMLLRKVDLHGRMDWGNPEHVQRLQKELAVICDNGDIDFSRYFLFLEQWMTWIRDQGALQGAGRGSAGGSFLAYLLKITHLNPLQYGLPFERFLSQARINRGKYPDIDLDLGQRDILLEKLKEVYGDKFAQCSTHGTLKVKSAIKDAARVLLPARDREFVDRMTKSIPNEPMGVKSKDFLLGYRDNDGNQHKGHVDENPLLKRFFDQNPQVYDMVLQLLGIPRSVGRHASAFFISDRAIHESVPTCVVSGEVCTQYTTADANYAEKAGLIKFDFLRINTLDDVSKCVRLIQKSMGYKVWTEKLTINGKEFVVTKGELSIEQIPMPDGRILNIYDLPQDDAVFDDICAGRTEALFQLSTPGMTTFCKRVQPRSVDDLSDIVALDRPGPLDALIEDGKTTMADAYILRKHKKMPVSYVHPDMEPMVKNTYGVFVYQEQLQRAFSDLAGYSHEDADYFREVLAKKKKQEMEKYIPQLREHLTARKWTETQIQVFVDVCIAASQYSFNMAHSAAYGVTAYICAFLKHYFSVEWWTAVLQNASIEDIREKGYVAHVRELLLMPHVNGAMETFEYKDGKIHAPLYLIDGVGPAACAAIKAAQAAGPFTSFQDFFDRVDKHAVNSRVFNQLVVCGAFDQIEPTTPAKTLLERYYYLTRVSKLAAGRGKSGAELVAAAEAYQAKCPDEAKQENDLIRRSEIELQILKVKSLPIYRCDVHKGFRQLLGTYFTYEHEDRPAKYTHGRSTFDVPRNTEELATCFRNSSDMVVWTGFVESAETFTYNDKKTGKKVEALKVFVSNNGDVVECVLWPDTYAQHSIPSGDRIVVVIGNIREARQAGKHCIFVKTMQEI
jgi:DNA polymerase-3 subunit alpha